MANKITCDLASNVLSPSGDEDVGPHPGVVAVAVGGSVAIPSAQWLRSEHSSNQPAPFFLWRSVAGSGCREPTRLMAPIESGSTEARIEEVSVAASMWLCERRRCTGGKGVGLCPVATALPVSDYGITFFCAYPQFLADQTAVLLVVLFYACDFPSCIHDHALRQCRHVSDPYTFVQCLLMTSLGYLRVCYGDRVPVTSVHQSFSEQCLTGSVCCQLVCHLLHSFSGCSCLTLASAFSHRRGYHRNDHSLRPGRMIILHVVGEVFTRMMHSIERPYVEGVSGLWGLQCQ